MKNNPLIKKLRGYQKAPRDRFFLLYNKTLTQEEFVLCEFGIAITDWDRDHTETYGTFQATNQEIAEILGWESDTTALRHKDSLIQKGLFIQVNEYLIKPKGFENWQLRTSKAAKIQDQAAKIQPTSSNIEEVPAKMQDGRPQKDSNSLVSFKGDLRLSKKDNSEDIPDEELDRIIKDLDQKDLGSFDFASQKNFGKGEKGK